jgi:hypothetical protein
MPTFIINGIAASVPNGTTILEAAKEIGIETPTTAITPVSRSRAYAACAS